MASATNAPTRRRESIYLVLTFMPLAVLGTLLAASYAYEARCAHDVHEKLAQLKASGELPESTPIILAQFNYQQPIPVAEVVTLSNAADYLNDRYRELFSKFPDITKLTPPSKTFDREKIRAKYRVEAKPIVELDWKRSVPYQITNATENDFRFAYHANDKQAAIELLQKLGFNPDLFLQSLQYDVWDANDLRTLREMAESPTSPDKQWQTLIRESLGWYVHRIDFDEWRSTSPWRRHDLENAFAMSPSQVLTQLDLFQGALKLRGIGARKSHDALLHLARESTNFGLLSLPTALGLSSDRNNGLVIGTYERLWDSQITRRRVTTAIAIKQFKLQTGRWPKSLDELTKVGLTSSDWKIVGNQDFGYRVAQDGKSVLLWADGIGYDVSPKWYDKDFQTSSQPPSELYMNNSQIESLQSTIR